MTIRALAPYCKEPCKCIGMDLRIYLKDHHIIIFLMKNHKMSQGLKSYTIYNAISILQVMFFGSYWGIELRA